ncbi:MAG: FIG146285: Diadenosine tetraphosphate (Ap4A) hydrolase and other HIT family hydrolases [uncultured Paraburkholderia sp.]|nr:MAG: FIG146285: Diadenosine tetraphosphate (Ap4A) hydrolase and other HIT family hydrolases [uncultured Paraburkholderia sp.]
MLVLTARLADQLGVAYTGGETGFRTVLIPVRAAGKRCITCTRIFSRGRVPGSAWADTAAARHVAVITRVGRRASIIFARL